MSCGLGRRLADLALFYGGLSEDLLRRDAEVIRAVGASSVVLSTDLGQLFTSSA